VSARLEDGAVPTDPGAPYGPHYDEAASAGLGDDDPAAPLRYLWTGELDPLFWRLARTGVVSAWAGHVPFAHWIVRATGPRVLVELGTEYGLSYSAFCEAVVRDGLDTRCFAIDTWRGDQQTRFYCEDVYADFRRFHDARYGAFSRLLRCTFDEALPCLPDGSIDLLHIDGLHTYDAARHDYDSWLPKLSDRAVVLLHDTNVRERDFGVWRLWEELRVHHPAFEFLHCHGLGMLAVGTRPPAGVASLCALQNARKVHAVRQRFTMLGERWEAEIQRNELTKLEAEVSRLRVESEEQRTMAARSAAVEAQMRDRVAEAEAARDAAEAARDAAADARVHAEAARDAEANARERAEAARVTAEADLRSEMAVAVARAAETERTRAEGALNLEAALRAADRRRFSSPTRRWRSATRRAMTSFGSNFSPRARRARRQLIRDAKLILKSPLFDVAWYVEGQRKLKGDRLDIALHYLRKGAAKGRNPSSRFDAAWYLERYPDVAAAGVNPLLHYLEHGAAEGRETRAAEKQQTPATMHGAATQSSLLRRFPALEPLRTFRGPHEPNWVTMITDGINAGLLFGGVGTAMVLSALIARRLGARLRLVTRTEPAHPGNFAAVLAALRVPWEGNIEFVHSPAGGSREVPVGDRDIFLTTSWWTTSCVRRAVDPRRIVYLLQEDERMFYPYGDERLRCSETFRDPELRFVVNTEALFRHFVDGPEPLPNLRTNGVWFEPAFPATTDNRSPRPHHGKHNFLFYARPNNLRNLYWRGLEAIEACLEEGILDPEAWEIHFVGRDLEDMVLPRGVRPRLAQNLPWAEYLSLVRRMDVGLSLMDTPHPSYPPLDLAAAGAVVVTNRHGPKTSLSRYSDNILCVEPTIEGLKCGIADAIGLAVDGPRRRANHARNRLGRDWEAAFEPVLQRLFPDGVVTAAAD
jgi:hypothetical protein